MPKIMVWTLFLLIGGVAGYLLAGSEFGRVVDERRAEAIGN